MPWVVPRSLMSTDSDPHRVAPTQSVRVQDLVAAGRTANLKRTRRTILSVAAFLVLIGFWHLVPRWRMSALMSEVERLEAYHAVTGRYPMTEVELETALRRCGFGGLWRKAEFKGSPLSGMGLKYRPDDDGSGFTLHFNHHCFCEPFDTSRYEYTSGDDSWCHWCD